MALNPAVNSSFCSVCFFLVQWGERESGSNGTCGLARFVLFLFLASLFVPLCFPPHRPYAGMFFLFVFLSPFQQYLFLFSTNVVIQEAFLIILDHILFNSCFGLFCSFFSSHFFFWSRFFCVVLVPGTLAFHVLCVD